MPAVPRRVCIAGGNGFVGRLLRRWFVAHGREVVLLTRRPAAGDPAEHRWDARTLGDWADVLRGCDAVINLAGRSVNCRYGPRNRRLITESRVKSTRVIGDALRETPGRVKTWLNASTATLYRHAEDRPQDEQTGEITTSSTSDDARPASVATGWQETWAFSVGVAKAWEAAFDEATAPLADVGVRSVALRMAIVMGRDPGGAFVVLNRLARLGLGGTISPGTQRVSFIHEHDLCRAVDFLLDRDDLSGPVNLVAPRVPVMRDFMAELRRANRMPIGLPTAKWQMHVGASVLRTEPELMLKSRWVYPKRLLDAGFTFDFGDWATAATELCSRRSRGVKV